MGLPNVTLETPEYISPQHARFRFDGSFLQNTIIWQCDLYTLQRYAEHFYTDQRPASLQQCINISDDEGSPRHIEVALNLPVIDDSAIHKTIIMIRNYKKLQVGKHCYGEFHHLDSSSN